MNRPTPGLLILAATEFELADFLDSHSHQCHKKRSGLTLYTGTGWDCLITGPGVFNTAAGLGAYLETHLPLLVLDTGIAGIFKASGLDIGDLAIAGQEQYLHTGVGYSAPLPFDLIDGQPLTREGIYSMDRTLVDQYKEIIKTQSVLPVAIGPFLTVSVITADSGRAGELFNRYSPIMESMEGAAAAHVCSLYQVPMIEVRAGSNLVGERDKANWDFSLACGGVTQICQALLAVLQD